jgi:hypothetical protein
MSGIWSSPVAAVAAVKAAALTAQAVVVVVQVAIAATCQENRQAPALRPRVR